jgi:predicted nucleic acid-binding protein
MKVILREQGSPEMLALCRTTERLACVALGYVELRAGLAQAARTGRVQARDYPGLEIDLRQLWRTVTEVPIDGDLIAKAGNDAETYALRSYDAVHLAALQVAGPSGTITFACWDRDLREAAGSIGYDLLPEHA